MTDVLAFLGVALFIGSLGLPLAFRLFPRFPDAGAGFAFPLALTLIAVGYFLLRVLDALPTGQSGFLLAILLFGGVNVLIAARDRRFLATLTRALPGIAAAAALFATLFVGYALFRAHVPEIAHTEQPMDFLYLNAMLVSPDYPPHDPWFAGERASYYYGGYLQAAVLTGASDVWPATGYNLSLAAVFASAGTAASSLCAALARWLFGRRSRRWIVLSAGSGVLLLLLSGPLAAVFELASAHGASQQGVYRAFVVEGLVRCEDTAAPCSGRLLETTDAWYPDDFWFWWRMSRMDNWEPQPAEVTTITEAPSFSFLLGDLHPHLMAIPGMLLALAIAAALWRARGPLSWRDYRRRPWLPVVLALLFGALAFVNVWDVVVCSLILGLAVLARNCRSQPLLPALGATLSFLLPAALLSVVLYLPWWLSFTPAAGAPYAYSGDGTRLRHVLLMWGVPTLFAFSLLWWALRGMSPRIPARSAAIALALPAIPLLLWLILVAFEQTAAPSVSGDGLPTSLEARTAEGWLTLAFHAVSLVLLTGATLALSARTHPATPLAALATLGILLLYLTELFLLRDLLFHLPRLNTVFKLSYEATVLLSIAGGVGVVAAVRACTPRLRPFVVAPVVVLLGASLVFVVIAIPNRAAGTAASDRTLDGLAFVSRASSPDYQLIRWLNEQVDPRDVVVEASGRIWVRGEEGEPVLERDVRSYQPAGRVAARTGLQTPIGWPGHELTWRGDSPEIRTEITRRQDLIDAIYTATSPAQALDALHQLGADWLVVGELERSHYPGLIPPFETFLELVFEAGDAGFGGVRVFRVPAVAVEVVATR